MVAAILEGRKTMTRRIIKPQPYLSGLVDWQWVWDSKSNGQPFYFSGSIDNLQKVLIDPELNICPYGRIGDILWVREEHYRFGHWVPVPDTKTATGKQKWMFIAETDEVLYSDNPPADFRKGRHHKDPYTSAWHKRLARFMPYKACRLFLKITDIRVERLQDIPLSDVKKEGCTNTMIEPNIFTFKSLWESINGAGSWEANPWVWVVSFKRIDKPE